MPGLGVGAHWVMRKFAPLAAVQQRNIIIQAHRIESMRQSAVSGEMHFHLYEMVRYLNCYKQCCAMLRHIVIKRCDKYIGYGLCDARV